jgi:hypothetical protein
MRFFLDFSEIYKSGLFKHKLYYIFVLVVLTISFPCMLFSQEVIDTNLVDQFHFEYPSEIIGLTYDGEYIWMSDIFADSLIAIDMISGEKVYGFPFPTGADIYGLTFDGENFWASASQFYLYKISHENGLIITSFQIPYPMASNARITELAWQNDILYCMNTSGFSSAIIGVDVATITCVDTVGTAGCASPTGLTFMNDHFWINDYIEIKIKKINPTSWQLDGWFPHYNLCYGNVGITNDGEFIYCSDGFRNIYKYEIIDNSAIEEDNIATIENPIQIKTYPNPFNPTTTIDFSIQNKSHIELSVFNIKGQKIKTLINKQMQGGNHSINWNGDNETGNNVSSGIYYYRLNVNGKTEVVNKCLLLK